jgi:hypothetical protein
MVQPQYTVLSSSSETCIMAVAPFNPIIQITYLQPTAQTPDREVTEIAPES